MKLIVGLGNPGKKYAATRHNVGFMVVDALAQEANLTWTKLSGDSLVAKGVLAGRNVVLLKPQTFMNESGKSVREVSAYFKIELSDIWVVHDDVDLPFGPPKLSQDSSAAGHHGVESIIETLGTQSFKRFRVGIGHSPEHKPVDEFVLEPFSGAEEKTLEVLILAATSSIELALKQGFSKAQELANQRKVPIT